MAQLRQDYELFLKENTIVVAIGPEEKEAFAKYWLENQMPFYGIPDPNHIIANQYGQKVSRIKLGRMPAHVIIDKQGVIKHLHYGDSMKDIPENDSVLEKIKELNRSVDECV